MRGSTFNPAGELRMAALLVAGLAIVLGLAYMSALDPVKGGLVALGAVVAVFAAVKYPEAVFALFLVAGSFKGDPRFQLPGIDATIVLGALALAGMLWNMLRGEEKLSLPPWKMGIPFLIILCWAFFLDVHIRTALRYGQVRQACHDYRFFILRPAIHIQ